MTTFLNGPAANVALMLRRAPLFLRLTLSIDHRGNAEWDALDQLGDTARRDENIFAYQLAEKPTWIHLHATGNAGGSFTVAKYRLCDPQPADLTMRGNDAWRAWCYTHAPEAAVSPANPTPPTQAIASDE